VVLVPVNISPDKRDLDYIGSLLDGLPIQAGDAIRATLFGSRTANFKIESTVPPGPVMINPTTQLIIGKSKSRKGRKKMGASHTKILADWVPRCSASER